MDLELTGRVVAVTGGSSGVGLATVRTLYDEGALVAACARDGDRLVKAVDDAGMTADRVLTHACDVRDESAVREFLGAIDDRFGRLDGLVNNAGKSVMKRLADTTVDDWHSELELKFAGLLYPTMNALPLLRASDGAAIVNVNALLAIRPEPNLVATSAARAGTLNLARSMADEFAEHGVRVNTVCLGLIDTGQWRRRYREAEADVEYPAWQRRLAADRGIRLGRLGTPEEVAAVIVFLLSPRCSYLTGATVDVTGGLGSHIH